MMENCHIRKSKPNRFKRKKAMWATWDEIEGSESEEDSDNEDAMMYMAIGEDNNEGDKNEVKKW